jgi:N-glycosylase/DNA lyase
MRLTLETPPGFSFARTVNSHGWCRLRPFRLGAGGKRLEGVVRRTEGGAVAFTLHAHGGKVVVESAGRGDAATRRLLRDTARRVLNLDLDLTAFHEAARRTPGMEWMAEVDAGRLLRSPDAFEDLVKLVMTTNCTWSFTTRMVDSFVERFGEIAPDGSRAFPGPGAIARAGTVTIRERCRTGYRAPALVRLAREAAAGRLDPESWERDRRDPGDLRQEMLRWPGVGPYLSWGAPRDRSDDRQALRPVRIVERSGLVVRHDA